MFPPAGNVQSDANAFKRRAAASTTSSDPSSAPPSSSGSSSALNTASWAVPAWSTLAAYLGTTGAAAVLGVAAYTKRDELRQGYGWMLAHLTFVGVLLQPKTCRRRLEAIASGVQGLGFANLYTCLGQHAGLGGGRLLPERTFCAMPRVEKAVKGTGKGEATVGLEARGWLKELNLFAKDEVEAHMSMFREERNPGYSRLLDDGAEMVVRWAKGEGIMCEKTELPEGVEEVQDLQNTEVQALPAQPADPFEDPHAYAREHSGITVEDNGNGKIETKGDPAIQGLAATDPHAFARQQAAARVEMEKAKAGSEAEDKENREIKDLF